MPADAPALAEVQVRTWWHAYADIVDHETLADQEVTVRGSTTLVWDQDGRIAGFVSYGDDEVMALYVDPVAQGAGVGGALLARAEQALHAGGTQEAWLWVLERNLQGREFYGGRGWRPDGATMEHPMGRHIRLRKGLA